MIWGVWIIKNFQLLWNKIETILKPVWAMTLVMSDFLLLESELSSGIGGVIIKISWRSWKIRDNSRSLIGNMLLPTAEFMTKLNLRQQIRLAAMKNQDPLPYHNSSAWMCNRMPLWTRVRTMKMKHKQRFWILSKSMEMETRKWVANIRMK